jgi:hypothetical protein
MIGCFNSASSIGFRTRNTASTDPPVEKGITIVMGRDGQFYS